MKKFLKRKYIIPAIIFVIMVGAFSVRFYKHESWLYFKMDQARDAFLIANAVQNGIGELPLLGPRAGATDLDSGFLRLGPAFYYFQYISGKLFNSISPAVFAYPDLLFSILVIPLLYLFSRIYFKRNISILILSMYAFSFIIIEYSRFAWNPNSLPFFMILSFLALLKFLNTENEKKRAWWIVLFSFALAIGSQLHFLGFFTLVGTSGLVIIYHFKLWKLESLRNIFKKQIFFKISYFSLLAISVFAFAYVPVIASDFKRNGENVKNFIQAISSKPTEQSLAQKFSRNIKEQLEGYSMITTSYVFSGKVSSSDFFAIIFVGAIFIFGIYLLSKKVKKNTDSIRKDFLMLIIFLFSVFFILCIPLSYQIRPRFFIPVFFVPFMFIGLIFEFWECYFPKKYRGAIFLFTAIILGFNFVGTRAWFLEQRDSQNKDVEINRTLILKVKDGITLGQLQGAVDYIYENKKEGSNIYYYIKPELVRPVGYLFFEKGDVNLNYYQMKINEDPNAEYFAIISSGSGTGALDRKFEKDFDILHKRQFGQITVYKIEFKDRPVSADFKFNEKGGSEDRIFLKDFFKK